jgi:transposase
MDNTFAFVYQLRMTIQLIDFMDQQLEDIEKQIEAIYSSCDCYLHTIIGVGVTTAAVIYAEVGNIDNFDYPKKLVAYAGMDPSRKQSGNYESTHNSMSKRGSTYLRRAVWNAAVVAAQKDPALNAFYLKKRDEGKDYMTTIGGVSHKLLNIVFAIMRDNKPYIPRP